MRYIFGGHPVQPGQGKVESLKGVRARNFEFCENLWRHRIESSQVHKRMVRLRLRVGECKSENMELYETF